MRKKFLSVALLGAFTFIAGSTFVSCKDYDDDISSLQTQINDLTTNQGILQELQDLLAKGVIISSVEKSDAGLKITTSNGDTYNLTNGNDGKDADVWTIGDDGFWYKNGEQTAYAAKGDKGETGATGATGAQGEKGDKGDTGATGATGAQGEKGDTGAAGKDGNYYVPNAETGMFDIYAADGTLISASTISWKANTLTATVDNGRVIFANVDGVAGGTYVISTILELKSLVFDPNLYYQGIEAIGVNTFYYAPGKVKNTANVNVDQTNDVFTPGTEAKEGANALFTAHYFLNPSNSVVSEDVSRYSFAQVKDVAYTRAAAECSPLSVKAVTNDEGYLTIKGTVTDPSKIKDIMNDEKVTVFALQYAQGDSTITSDFAALRAYRLKDFIINKVSEKGKVDEENLHTSHLYTTAQEAVSNNDMLQITYNDAVGVCLNDWINVHANINGTADLRWGGQQTIAESGYKMKYELIGYKNGDFLESTYAKIENDTIKAVDPKTGKTPEVVSVIGRTPLMRVTLIDTNDNNKIVAAGYMKVKIVGESSDVTVDLKSDAKIACGDEVVINTAALTGQQVIDSLMSQAAFSKFALVTDASGNAVQYTKEKTEVQTTDIWGQVKSDVKTNAKGEVETYLNVTVKNGDAYAAFSKAETKSVIVRYTDGTSDVYVTINITNPLMVKPVVDLANSKTETPWFAENGLEKGTGSIHAHVNEGTSSSADWTFSLDDANWKIGDKVATLSNVIKAQMGGLDYNSAYNNGPIYRFVLPTVTSVPTSTLGHNVTLSISERGDSLFAADKQLGKQLVAEVDTTNGDVKFIGYNPTDPGTVLAGEVLNAFDHKSLNPGETFTARVGIDVYACDPVGKLDAKNNEFDVKFLRPISFKNSDATIIDSDPTTYDPSVFVSFDDWRNWAPSTFKQHTGKDFVNFYGLQSIEQDPDGKLTTDFATTGKFVEIDAPLTSYFDLTMDKFTFAGSMSGDGINVKVHYTKKSTVAIKTFQAQIPVILTYKWGKLAGKITVTIQPTTGSNAARRK